MNAGQRSVPAARLARLLSNKAAARPGVSFQGLSSSEVKGTASILRPDAQVVSPALGLVQLQSNAFVGNLLTVPPPKHVNPNLKRKKKRQRKCRQDKNHTSKNPLAPGLRQSCWIAQELFFRRDSSEPPAVTRSRSRAAFYLTPARLGHLVGMAIDDVDRSQQDIESILKNHCQISGQTTSGGYRAVVDGVSTNVSLSRFLRLYTSVSDAYVESSVSPAIPLILRFLWERAQSKQCLLNFLDVVHDYRPIYLDPNFRHNKSLRSAWVRDNFTPVEMLMIDEVESAALQMLSLNHTREKDFTHFGRSIELVAANLSSAHAFKPPLRLEQHSFRGAKPKPDCVEVVVREIIDYLLFDPQTMLFDETRLPVQASPMLKEFYCGLNASKPEASESALFGYGDAALEVPMGIQGSAASRWFHICSALPGGVEYTSSSKSISSF